MISFGKEAGEAAGKIIDSVGQFFDTPEKKMAAEKQLQDFLQSQGQQQTDVNKVEAAHRSIWVAGWRPGVGWGCVLGIFGSVTGTLLLGVTATVMVMFGIDTTGVMEANKVWQSFMDPLEEWLMELVFGMLSMAGLRTFEKLKGISK